MINLTHNTNYFESKKFGVGSLATLEPLSAMLAKFLTSLAYPKSNQQLLVDAIVSKE